MKRTFCTYCRSALWATLWLLTAASCSSGETGDEEQLLPYVDTRVGTAPSTTHTAGTLDRKSVV